MLAVGGLAPSQALAGPPAPRLMAGASEPDQAVPRLGRRIDASALGDDGDGVARRLGEILDAETGEQGFEPGEPPYPQLVVVVARARNREDPGYVVGFSVESRGEIVAGSARQLDCSLCTRTELVERIEAQLPALFELARAHQPSDDGGTSGPAGPNGGTSGDTQTGDPTEVPPAIGPLGYAGIGVGVVGLAGVGTGIGLLVRGVQPIEPTFVERRNFRPGGAVGLAVGGAALVAGVAMLVVDLSRRRSARRRAASRVRVYGLGIAF